MRDLLEVMADVQGTIERMAILRGDVKKSFKDHLKQDGFTEEQAEQMVGIANIDFERIDEALKKTIPQKAIAKMADRSTKRMNPMVSIVYYCRACNHVIGFQNNAIMYNYCPHCGQKIAYKDRRD